jgi:NitT/TauT family transport system substrate-binding protein
VFFATGRAIASLGFAAQGSGIDQQELTMRAIPTIHKFLLAAVAIGAVVGLSGRLHADELTIGTIGASSDAPFFVADKKGYFADEGLKVKFIRFDSAAKMIPSLGSGEVDVGSGATSAGLYNAVKRGIGIKIVADKARNAKGYGFEAIMARKVEVDSGKIKSLKDFKGLKVAISAKGNSEAAILNHALKTVGLNWSDVEPVYLGFPSHIAAFQNGAVDASVTVEPTVSQLLKLGTAVRLVGIDDIYPDAQTAVIFYGANFIKNKPEDAKKFMKALVRGMRTYNDALKDGHIAGPNADEIISILTEYSFIKDPAVHRAIISQAVDPDGHLNMDSLQESWQFFKDTNEIDGSVKVDDVVDLSFVKAASQELGPYVKKTASK